MAFTPLLQGAVSDAMFNDAALGRLFAMMAGMIIFLLVLLVVLYIYSSLTLMIVAKRLNVEPAWLAWIPIANLYLMSKIAKQPWWPILFIDREEKAPPIR